MSLVESRNTTEIFLRDGYIVLPLYSPTEQMRIQEFTRTWLWALIKSHSSNADEFGDLEHYHLWWEKAGVDHNALFRAANRYCVPDEDFQHTVLNDNVDEFLSAVLGDGYTVWKDGLGWLGFRCIRPGMNDGYPSSCKAWGPAKDVLSLWIPVIGHSENETLALIPGSHTKEFKKYLPENSKFCAEEYRVDEGESLDFHRPSLQAGDAILFDARTIHTEDVTHSPITRLNLEVRFNPPDGKG